MLHPKGFDFDFIKRGRKGQKKPEGIPVGLYSLRTDPSDGREVLIEKLMDQR